MIRRKNRLVAEKTEKSNRLNREIHAPRVRLIGPKGEQIGIVSIKEALYAADTADLDLVEISPNAEPPVCRIMDYGKFLFELSKQRAATKKKQKQVQLKEMKFRPTTEEGDYQVKLRKLIGFLTEGNKAKVTLRFRGREVMHIELGTRLMDRIQTDLTEYGIIEQFPKMEGRQMVMVLGPKKPKTAGA